MELMGQYGKGEKNDIVPKNSSANAWRTRVPPPSGEPRGQVREWELETGARALT